MRGPTTTTTWLHGVAAMLAAIAPTVVDALSYTSVQSPDLDLSQLGRVALAGNFDSISLYDYVGQTDNSYTTNGSLSLLARYPDGAFESVAMADAYIETMCPFVTKDGTFEGIVVGGNFTSLGGVQAQGIALYNPNTSAITPLPGLSGRVSSVYCDQETSTVYVGGSFTGANSSNAIAWTTGWTNLPFAGFNGPVNSIAKRSNGSIIFAGSFDGLGNTSTPTDRDMQVINLSAGNITSVSSTSTSGFSDPSNIICRTGQDASGSTWLLEDGTAGSWQANFGFGFNPTKLRLYNTNYEGRGTKTFRLTAIPNNGIMNLTYIDSNGQNASCTSQCPLPQGNTTAQDFHFVNVIGMNGFRIDVSAWYGAGGGFSGIEMFQDDIYSFAIPKFNEPQCDDVSTTGANATATGAWKVTPSGTSTSDYLTANLTKGTSGGETAQVVFQPDIKQSGNYSITLYTPGCIQDDTCDTRGIVNITGTMTSDSQGAVSSTLYQTNDYDKYDQIYYGYVDANDDSFRPTVTLAPAADQSGPLTVVAQRVHFILLTSTGGLNGIYEYDPNEATADTDFSSSTVDSAGASLNSDATINSLAVYDDTIFVAGNFTNSNSSHIFSIDNDGAAPLAGGGLNAEVLTTYLNGSTLYVGGNFTNTAESSATGLNGIAAYSVSSSSWQALGAGVNGPVWSIVPLQLNITSSVPEDVLVISGDFSQVYSTGSNTTFSASGLAVWVPAQSNWLNNIPSVNLAVRGELTAQTSVPGSSALYAGSLDLQESGMSGAVSLSGSGSPSLESLGLSLSTTQQSTSSVQKRATTTSSSQNITGVAAGIFYSDNGLNITVLGGHFTANATNGSTIYNLLFLNDTSSQTVTGLPSTIDESSQFLSMDTHGTQLFAGGAVTGTANDNDINGLVVYDLATGALVGTQPPALAGGDVTVNAVAAQPSNSYVYVGGKFTSAGSLPCATLCMYDTSTLQWMSAGVGLGGSIASMIWASNTQLVIAGNLTTGTNTTMMATYDSKSQTFTDFPGASNLPGPINAITPADAESKQFWVAGTATANNSYYLSHYDGSSWTTTGGLGSTTSIRGLQLISTTSNHDSAALMSANKVLLITGSIEVPNYGNASAVLFNGTTFTPFALTSESSGGESSLARMFVENPSFFSTKTHHYLDRGFVVLIGLAIALALIFLIVVAGIFIERYRRHREGYVPMKQYMRPDQTANLSRIPPERLFGTLTEKDAAPKI